jgi:hypothetical protein
MATYTTFYCVEGIVPVLLEPDPQSERLTDLLFGEEFIAKSESEGLVFGATAADDIEGFVPRGFLAPKLTQPTHQVRRTFIHVYHAPDLLAASGKILPMNAAIELTGRSAPMRSPGGTPGTLAVELGTGGWVTAQAVAPIEHFEKNIRAVAASFIGAVYLPGGKTWLGCDGPGLIQTVLAACGSRVPRQFSQQIRFFEHKHHDAGTHSASRTFASVVYSTSACGFLLGNEVIAARTETMQVDATSFENFTNCSARHVFHLLLQ